MRSSLTNPQTQPRGIFDFDRLMTSNAGASGTGHAFASFLLGYPNRVRRDIVDTYPEVRRKFLGLFLQDDFRVTQKLTLQLGLRWDLATPPMDANNRQSNFSIEDGLIHVASDDNRGPNLDTHYDYFAPRLGLAYTPDNGKTALRAAFGISYFPDNFGANGGTNERNYPFFQEVDLVAPNRRCPSAASATGCPPSRRSRSRDADAAAGFAVFYIPRDFHEDTATMWNVGIQRELGWHTMVDVSYVGTRGTNIFRSRNINVPDPEAGQHPAAAAVLRHRAQRHRHQRARRRRQVLVQRPPGQARQAFLARPAAAGRLHVLEDGGRHNTRAGHPPHRAGRPRAHARAEQGHRHPAQPGGERDLRAALRRPTRLVKGWSISAITTYQSGDPLDIRVSASRLNTGTGNWADVTCGEIGTPNEVARWFDTSCFADPAQFVFGNYTIGDVRGPYRLQHRPLALQADRAGPDDAGVRADVFNVFNKAHFSNPNSTFGNAQFGVISGTRLPPREIQLGLRLLF